MFHRSASGPAAPGQRFKTRIARRSSQDHELRHITASHRTERATLCSGSFATASQSDWQTCQLLLLDSGERRLLACSVRQPAERLGPTLTDRNVVGGKAAANYRLAACAPQNHASHSFRFPPEPACALLQKQKSSPVSRGASRFRGFTIMLEPVRLLVGRETEGAGRRLNEV